VYRFIEESIMGASLKELEEQALRLPPNERGELAHRLLVSLDGESADSPAAIAQAWDEEIVRRVADMDAGRAHWTSADEVMAKLHARIAAARADAG
jgi:putative addiction module component (TIGR02574 family)